MNMTGSYRKEEQENEILNLWVENSEEQENVINETQRDLWSTQVQLEIQQSTQQLKQDIDKDNFCNYMKEHWTDFESQPPEIKNLMQKILWPREEVWLTKEKQKYNELKSELIEAIKRGNFVKIAVCVAKFLKEFLWWFVRILNIGEGLNYILSKNYKEFLINAINATLDPEKRSKLTYLLWKIKDEGMKESLKKKGVENPTQFQLFLQNCKPWQLLLTNAETIWPEWQEDASKATQIVSWSRWCHSAVISDIIKENWVVIDAKLVHTTWTSVEEISLKEYFNKKYIRGDLLLWTFWPTDKWYEVVKNCKEYVWVKSDQINWVSDIMLDKLHVPKDQRNEYCSDLVFTWMQKTWLELPEPHITPSDLLSTSAVTPEYCCYCDTFQ